MKKVVTVLILSFFLILAGCSGSGGKNPSTGTGFSLNSYQGGNLAIKAEFAQGAPPEKIRDQGKFPFSVRVMLENVGEYDIDENSAYVALAGTDARVLGLSESSKIIPAIRGVKLISGDVRSGGKQQVTFSNMKYTENLGAGSLNVPLYAYICYPYKTLAQSSLCLSGDTYQLYDEDVTICDLESKRESISSGSPISIENVEQRAASDNSIEFQFDIVHKPTTNLGRLFKSNSISQGCLIHGNSPTSSEAETQEDYVYFDVSTGVNLPLTCTKELEGVSASSGYVKLYDGGRVTVYCTQETTKLEEQQKLVKIELSYDYLERISTSLLVEHVN